MEHITELIGKINELSEKELGDLEGMILSEFETLEKQDQSPQTVEGMVQLADSLDAVRGEKTRREGELAELGRRAEEAAERIRSITGENDGADAETEDETVQVEEKVAASNDTVAEPAATPAATEAATAEASGEGATAEATGDTATATAQADTSESADNGAPEKTTDDSADDQAGDEQDTDTEAPAEDGEQDTDTTEEQEGTVTAAAGTNVNDEPAVEAPVDRRPVAKVLEAPVAITAGADIPGVSAGAPLGGMKDIAGAMVQRMHQMRRTAGGDGEQHTIATLTASFPEERTLKSSDPDGNTNKVKAATSLQAITAAGGICAPIQVNYDLYDIGSSADRPVKDALGNFNADRGGIRFMTPPLLQDLAGAVSLWTLQDDIDAATPGAPDPVKPCLRVACSDEVTVYTDAIPLCLTFGNMGARAYPEMVTRHNELALVQHARFAETRLLTRIGTLSTAVTAGRQLGAAIDFLVTVDRAQAAYRSRHRLTSIAPMRVIAPAWMLDLMRADLAKRMPGDGLESNLAIADAQINAFFRARNINITWTLDGEAGQVFGNQTAGALLDYPDNVVWYMFAEGTFLFLDGGTLDLGLVRDSTLNGTNDYKMFIETFEGVAKIGVEALRVTSRMEPTGQVAGTVDTGAGL